MTFVAIGALRVNSGCVSLCWILEEGQLSSIGVEKREMSRDM